MESVSLSIFSDQPIFFVISIVIYLHSLAKTTVLFVGDYSFISLLRIMINILSHTHTHKSLEPLRKVLECHLNGSSMGVGEEVS